MSTIKIDLFSSKSIQSAISDIEKEKTEFLQKCEDYVNALAKLGHNVALEQVGKSPLGNTITVSLGDITASEAGCKVIITAIGKTYDVKNREPFHTLLAVEFGAGISYNRGNDNPNADKYGYGVGTYPDQIHAFEDGWYYLGTDGKYHYTKGVKATMPIFSAYKEMLESFKEVGQEIFGEVK